MHRLVLTLTALVFAAPACTADEGGGGMLILQNNVPGAEDDGCTIEAGPSTAFRGGGRLDLAFQNNTYELYPVVASRIQVTDTAPDELQRTISFREIEINFGEAIAGGFTSFLSGTLMPGGETTVVSQILASGDLSGLSLSGDDRAVAVVELRVIGDLQGGRVESDPFFYPIEICDGCLRLDLGDCSALPVDFEATFRGGECNPRQDEIVQCCTEGGIEICPAVSTQIAP